LGLGPQRLDCQGPWWLSSSSWRGLPSALSAVLLQAKRVTGSAPSGSRFPLDLDHGPLAVEPRPADACWDNNMRVEGQLQGRKEFCCHKLSQVLAGRNLAPQRESGGAIRAGFRGEGRRKRRSGRAEGRPETRGAVRERVVPAWRWQRLLGRQANPNSNTSSQKPRLDALRKLIVPLPSVGLCQRSKTDHLLSRWRPAQQLGRYWVGSGCSVRADPGGYGQHQIAATREGQPPGAPRKVRGAVKQQAGRPRQLQGLSKGSQRPCPGLSSSCSRTAPRAPRSAPDFDAERQTGLSWSEQALRIPQPPLPGPLRHHLQGLRGDAEICSLLGDVAQVALQGAASGIAAKYPEALATGEDRRQDALRIRGGQTNTNPGRRLLQCL